VQTRPNPYWGEGEAAAELRRERVSAWVESTYPEERSIPEVDRAAWLALSSRECFWTAHPWAGFQSEFGGLLLFEEEI